MTKEADDLTKLLVQWLIDSGVLTRVPNGGNSGSIWGHSDGFTRSGRRVVFSIDPDILTETSNA